MSLDSSYSLSPSSSRPHVYLAGATGLTGLATFQTLSSSCRVVSLTTLTRRALPGIEGSNVPYRNVILDMTAPSTWRSPFSPPSTATPPVSPSDHPVANVFISCLGTTLAAAGSAEGQEKIDFGLNLELAKAAKAQGVEKYILVSTAGASSSSHFAYPSMKDRLENAVQALGFRSTIILRPGVLMGDRHEDRRMSEVLLKGAFSALRAVGMPGMQHLMVDGEVVGRCIANLATLDTMEGVRYLSNAQIIAEAERK